MFGDLLYLIRNTSTVGEALVELRANFSLYNGAAEIGLDVQGKQAVLSFKVNDGDTPGRSQAEELACGVAIQLMRALVGSNWQPDRTLLGHAPLSQATDYLQVLGCKPTLFATCTGLVFDVATLTLPLSKGDEGLHQMIAEHLGRMERLKADELPNYVRQLLRDLLPSGRATVEKVAGCMALHPRTLQRRLTLEGTSFQQLLDDTRQNMARHYLQDPTISMAQMAGLLGYSDPSGFSRAFHRWFDATPLAWQRQYGPKRQPRLLRKRSSII
ncbi:HTH-type transcriptional regulator VirS [compost metagenome]